MVNVPGNEQCGNGGEKYSGDREKKQGDVCRAFWELVPEAKDGKEKQAEAYVFVRCGNKTAAFEELSDGSLQAEQQFVRKLGETDTRCVVCIML